MVSVVISASKKKIESTFRRDWRNYSKSVLLSELALVEWTNDIDKDWNLGSLVRG